MKAAGPPTNASPPRLLVVGHFDRVVHILGTYNLGSFSRRFLLPQVPSPGWEKVRMRGI